jgi:aspartate-semialdehyde dehydrogenase
MGHPSATHPVHRCEEEKIETEPRMILCALQNGESRFIPFATATTTTSLVPEVQNGHTESTSVGLEQKPTADDIIEAWTSVSRGSPQELGTATAPPRPIVGTCAKRIVPQPLLTFNRATAA